jgi:hypothetical protein
MLGKVARQDRRLGQVTAQKWLLLAIGRPFLSSRVSGTDAHAKEMAPDDRA